MGLKFISSFPITYFIYFMNVKWRCREQSCELPCAELQKVSVLNVNAQKLINEMEVARHEMPGISLAKKQMHQEKNKKDSV